MYGRATIHPKLIVDEGYDGMHPKLSEMNGLIDDLPGKPLQFEHNDSHVVGTVLKAFPSSDKQGIDILFSTFPDTFKGKLVDEMMTDGKIKDVSMTIKAYKGEHSNGVPYIAHKEITEVSLVEQGDINGSNIHWTIPKEYIKPTKSNSKQTMSTQQPQQTPQMQASDDIAKQMLAMSERNSEIAKRMSELEKQNNDLLEAKKRTDEQLNMVGAQNRAKREKDMGQAARLFKRVMDKLRETNELEANQYAPQVENFKQSMLENHSANGLTAVMAQASIMMESSFNDVEQAFQREKKLKEEMALQQEKFKTEQLESEKYRNEMIATIKRMSGSTFQSPEERGYSPNTSFESTDNKRKEQPDTSYGQDTLIARASKFFKSDTPIDDSFSRTDFNDRNSTFKVENYVNQDNAGIFADLASLKGNSGTIECLFKKT